jgi:PAS domain S-box-containing protein
MNAGKILNYFPFTRLIRLLIFLSLGLQLIVISQMYFFRADIFSDPALVAIRLFRGVILTFFAGAILAYPSIYMIRLLNKMLPWKSHPYKRLLFQFPFAAIIGLLVTPIILLPASWFFGLESDVQTMLNNAYYLIILALFLMIILEARMYFDENARSKLAAEVLTRELIQEAANRSMYEAQIKMEEEKNKYAQQLIEQEKQLNRHLEEEIKKRELVTGQLNESREQLNSILSNLAGAAYRCYFDEQYTMKYISEKIFDISGYHAYEFIDNSEITFSKIIHPEDQELCRNNILEATCAKRHYEFEYRIIHKDGQVVWVNENGKGIYNQQGELEFLDGIILDITRRKAAEFAASESERNFIELMELFPQPIFELDIQGNILFTNGSGKEFFGIVMPENPEEKISALDYMVEEDVPRVQENIKKSNQAILSTPIEYTVKRPDGSRCPVLIYGSPIFRNGKVVGRRGIIIDISERKKQEEKLLKAKAELERINNTLEQRVAERTKQLTDANTKLLRVQKENLQSQFEVLKQQVNPHFLFNSLNVLSSLINKDISKAQIFIDEFSQIYRYVLETIEKTVVTLNKELSFARSYIYLQQIRYGENLNFTVNLPSDLLNLYMPPLSLQVVLENAVKHNIVNESHLLNITIVHDDNWLIVSNNIQPKISMGKSTGLGQKNMVKRYNLISERVPLFQVVNNQYVVKLPLLNIENDERTDH